MHRLWLDDEDTDEQRLTIPADTTNHSPNYGRHSRQLPNTAGMDRRWLRTSLRTAASAVFDPIRAGQPRTVRWAAAFFCSTESTDSRCARERVTTEPDRKQPGD